SRFYQTRAFLPFVDQRTHNFAGDHRLICGNDDDSFRCLWSSEQAASHRSAHLTFNCRVNSKDNVRILEVSFEIRSTWAVGNDDNYDFNAATAQVVYAGLNYSLWAERKEWLERAHAL